jgi:hypothetical protein
MKHDWKKEDKKYYLPKNEPELIEVPEFGFFSIKGEGNPNDAFFGEYIQVLYSLSYAVKMSPKSGKAPAGYFDYTVYPLEGVWDLKDASRIRADRTFDKNDLIFKLMMRQPDFVTPEYAAEIIEYTQKKKLLRLLGEVTYNRIAEGLCIQMLHNGPYDAEPESFRKMEAFAGIKGLARPFHFHREIYLSDARKVSPDKLRTVLRFTVC